MSTNKLSIHSINKVVEKVPGEMLFRYHLSKVDLDSLQEVQSKILTSIRDQILTVENYTSLPSISRTIPIPGTLLEITTVLSLKTK